MSLAVLIPTIMLWTCLGATAFGQTIEMAAQCEEAQKQLAELIKNPDTTHAQKIKDALGLDVLNSCPAAEGQIVCYQCIDKDRSLRTLQLLQKKDTKRFELLGFGCNCRDEK